MRTCRPRCLVFAVHAPLLPLLLGACAGAPEARAKLPFHVAVIPPVAIGNATAVSKDGNPTELVFAVDERQLAFALHDALAATFTMVTPLPAPASAGAATDWLAAATQQRADLVLQPTLRFDPELRTALNDRFWLNLPLFALGGPFCWWVSDRSYHCYSRLEGQLFDVAVAATRDKPALEGGTRVLRVEREVTEASLRFTQRADGAGAYVLSLVCPAGLLAQQSSAVPAQLDRAVVFELCQAMAKSLMDRATEITESDLVGFHPRGVAVTREGGMPVIAGEMVLGLGQANELGSLRYRVDGGEFVDAAFGAPALVSVGGADKGRRVYPFRIALPATARSVQLEVEQLDRAATRRTFTYVVGDR